MSFKVQFFLAISLLFQLSILGQSLNSYQYVIVPEKFDFQKGAHDYDVNKMLQFTFNKYNFKAFLKSEALPAGLSACDALHATLTGKGFLKTALTLHLKDCNGKTIYTSPEGTSMKKDYKVAYFQSIREIFKASPLRGHQYNAAHKSKRSIAAEVARPKPVKPIQEAPTMLKGKKQIETPAKATGPLLVFNLRAKQYIFKPIGKNYIIKEGENTIGQASLNPDNVNYTLEAGSLSGKGHFDDYGNFVLNRVNPLNQKSIKDILARQN